MTALTGRAVCLGLRLNENAPTAQAAGRLISVAHERDHDHGEDPERDQRHHDAEQRPYEAAGDHDHIDDRRADRRRLLAADHRQIRQEPARPSARPVRMFFALRGACPVRIARPVALSLAAL